MCNRNKERYKNDPKYRKYRLAYSKKFRIKNKEYLSKWNKAYRKRGGKKLLKRNNESKKISERKQKIEILTHYSKGNKPKCVCCGTIVYEFLGIDHKKRRRKNDHKSGKDLYRWLKKRKFPKDYQTMCMNCNSAKGFFGKCPHKIKT